MASNERKLKSSASVPANAIRQGQLELLIALTSFVEKLNDIADIAIEQLEEERR